MARQVASVMSEGGGMTVALRCTHDCAHFRDRGTEIQSGKAQGPHLTARKGRSEEGVWGS